MKKATHKKPRHKTRRQKPARAELAHASAGRRHAPRSRSTIGHAGRVGSHGTAHRATSSSLSSLMSGLATRLSTSRDFGIEGTRAAARWLRRTPAACARAIPLPAEDREIAALLLAPFFILAVAIAGNQSLQLGRHLKALIAHPVPPVTLPQSQNAPDRQITLRPAAWQSLAARSVKSPPGETIRTWKHPTDVATAIAYPERHAGLVDAAHLGLPATATALNGPADLRATTPRLEQLAARAPEAPLADAGRPPELALAAPAPRPASRLQPAGTAIASIDPGAFAALSAVDEDEAAGGTRRLSLLQRCTLPAITEAREERSMVPASWFAPPGDTGFGPRLAAAARRQLDGFVIYDAGYRRIAYPRGDVPSLYGVCTDVVIRAYRDLGIDLQVAVQQARVGSGDRNIDHRRTETLRRFFQRVGTSLPVTSFPEEYLPGDIVTYARPQNTGTASRSHIAMVSDVMAPSGRPMIIHNRGWGPQLEDALFVDRITGHYRYAGPDNTANGGATPLPATPLPVGRREMTGTIIDKPVRRSSRARTAAASRALR